MNGSQSIPRLPPFGDARLRWLSEVRERFVEDLVRRVQAEIDAGADDVQVAEVVDRLIASEVSRYAAVLNEAGTVARWSAGMPDE